MIVCFFPLDGVVAFGEVDAFFLKLSFFAEGEEPEELVDVKVDKEESDLGEPFAFDGNGVGEFGARGLEPDILKTS